MASIRSPRAFLVRRSPQKLSPYERSAIVSLFGDDKPELIRIEIADAYSHFNFCKKNMDKNLDIVFLPKGLDFQGLVGLAVLASESGYTHAFFGEGLDIRKLTGMTVKSRKF